MSRKTKMIIAGVILGLSMCLLCYYQFIAVQGMLTLISKQGTLIVPMLGSTFFMFEITAFISFIFHIFGHNEKLGTAPYAKFLKRNGYFISISGVLAIIFLIYNVVTSPVLGDGPTFAFPYDMLLLAIIGTVFGVLATLKGYQVKVSTEEVLKPTKAMKTKKAFMVIAYFLIAYVAIDRFGGIISYIYNGTVKSAIVYIIPLVIQIIGLLIALNSYEIYRIIKDEKAKKILWIVGAVAGFVLATGGFVGQWIHLLGANSTYAMKTYSQFYGLDRLATMPITLILIGIISIVPPLYALIKFIIKNVKKN